MRILTFVPSHNSPGKSDASGAFQPEARAFLKHHKAAAPGTAFAFPSTANMGDRRKATMATLMHYAHSDLDAVAFFCHGWRDGIQAGFVTDSVRLLADAIRSALKPVGGRVILFCCDTGRDADADRDDDRLPSATGRGGFASSLSAKLPKIEVFGHATAGHTTRNPYAMQFRDGVGAWLTTPGGVDWSLWVDLLKGPARFDAPFMIGGGK